MTGNTYSLAVEPRELVGKKVKRLRAEGIVPGVIYGEDFEEQRLVQVDRRELRKVLAKAAGTQVVELDFEGEKVATLVQDVHRDIIRGDLLHVDFYAIDMNKPTTADVRVIIVGTTPVVAAKTARVARVRDSITVEALPALIPRKIEADISWMREIGEEIRVEDLPLPEGVTAVTEPERVVIRLGRPGRAELATTTETGTTAVAAPEGLEEEELEGEEEETPIEE